MDFFFMDETLLKNRFSLMHWNINQAQTIEPKLGLKCWNEAKLHFDKPLLSQRKLLESIQTINEVYK